MSSEDSTGTIFLPTLSACALFKHELKGQLCDGMWENAAPLHHWHFWVGLDVVLSPGPAQVVPNGTLRCVKTGYNIAALYPIVGARMLAKGRMGKAIRAPELLTHNAVAAAEDMLKMTYEGWARRKVSGKWEFPWMEEHHADVTPDMAFAFFRTVYGASDLRNDVRSIKAAMKTARPPMRVKR